MMANRSGVRGDPATWAAYMRAWRIAHPEQTHANARAYYARIKYTDTYREKIAARTTQQNASHRADILAFFGGRCARCQVTDPRVLQMDHINGGGAAERRAGRLSLYYRWKAIRDDPEGAQRKFQLLCANCNVIKRCERREYNHTGRPRLEFKEGL